MALTATAELLGDPLRFSDGKALASYIGMIPASLELSGSSNTSSWSHVIGQMSGGQHRVDEVTRTEPVGWTGEKNNPRIAAQRSVENNGAAQLWECVRKELKKSETLLTRPTSLEMLRNLLSTLRLHTR